MSGKPGMDRRVLYTKMFLREALFELMREKPIGKITPTELCRKANINRNIFTRIIRAPKICC
jgi:predicted transcriptional regulator